MRTLVKGRALLRSLVAPTLPINRIPIDRGGQVRQPNDADLTRAYGAHGEGREPNALTASTVELFHPLIVS
jgi:hypothetical protein